MKTHIVEAFIMPYTLLSDSFRRGDGFSYAMCMTYTLYRADSIGCGAHVRCARLGCRCAGKLLKNCRKLVRRRGGDRDALRALLCVRSASEAVSYSSSNFMLLM